MERTSRHAYMITVNSNLRVLSACLKALDNDWNDFYILFDRKSFPTQNSAEKVLPALSHAGIRFVGVRLINWGGYTQVEAELELLSRIVEFGEQYSYVHFLQNSDLPVRPDEDIVRFFENNSGKEFVNVNLKSTEWARKCCQLRYFLSQNRFYRRSRLVSGVNVLLARVQDSLHIRTNTDMRFYHGSAIFSITLPFAEYILSRRKEIEKRFRWALAPDEKFVQTILMDSPFRENVVYIREGVTSNALLVDWKREREKNSPHVWRESEYDDIISLSKDCCYARKFREEVDLGIVEKIFDLCNAGGLL